MLVDIAIRKALRAVEDLTEGATRPHARASIYVGLTVLLTCVLGCRHNSAEDNMVLENDHATMTPEKKAWLANTKVTKTRDWSPVAILACLRPGPLIAVRAIGASYLFDTAGSTMKSNIPCTIFVDPQTRNVWAGRLQEDFYLENRQDILGILLSPYGILRWNESLIPKAKPGESIDSLIHRFERLNAARHPLDLPTIANTDLREILNREFFRARPGATNTGYSTIKDATLEKNTLVLDLASPTGVFKARLWIDVATKEVIKAVEDGKPVVLPKRTRPAILPPPTQRSMWGD